jgi:hypothetical protein
LASQIKGVGTMMELKLIEKQVELLSDWICKNPEPSDIGDIPAYAYQIIEFVRPLIEQGLEKKYKEYLSPQECRNCLKQHDGEAWY